MTTRVEVLAVPGIPEVRADDDLAVIVVNACREAGLPLRADDVVVVASKIVSKAEGRFVADQDRDAAVRTQTRALVAHRVTARGRTAIVRSAAGPVMAAAGVDASNVPHGTLLLLPVDPDASARRLRAGLHALTGLRIGVVISDTLGRPWREGQTDVAIGAAGVAVVDDLRGSHDREGRRLDVTVRAVADELAAAADLVKGKLQGTPLAVLRGLAAVVDADGPGAATLVRHGDQDWFRWGALESVEHALGHEVGDVPPAHAGPLSWSEALTRSLILAAGPLAHDGLASPDVDLAPLVRERDVATEARRHSATFAVPEASSAWVSLAVRLERLLVALRAHGHPCRAQWGDGVVRVEALEETHEA